MAEVPSGVRSKAFLSLVGALLVASALVSVGVVVPARPAAAATVTFGAIQAQMANQLGVNDGTGGSNCIRYAPTSTPTVSPSNFVTSPAEAQTAHGRSGSGNNCPATLSTTTQSAMGFRPGTATAAADGVPFLIGRMVHYNNPITASDEYFTGTMNIRLSGFSTTTIAFPWTLDETPNSGPNPNDEIAFSNQISDVTIVQGGLTFRLVVDGFIQTGTGTTCPETPAGTPQNRVLDGRGHPDPRLPLRHDRAGAHPDHRQAGQRDIAAGAHLRLHVLLDARRVALVQRVVQPLCRRDLPARPDERQHGHRHRDRPERRPLDRSRA